MGRRIAMLASIALALAAPAAHAQFEPRIIGGSPTTIDQYPWQAAVVYDPAKAGGNPFQRQFCGGSLITPSIVLTAAHCIHGTDPQNNSDLDPDDVNVVLGQTTLSTAPSSSEHDVQGVSKQSNYDDSYGPGGGVPSNDVGYLVLQTPYNGATPIDIAGSDESALWDAGSPEQITGWGATATSGPGSGGSDTLRHATVPIVTDSGCASDYGVYFNSSTMVCAGYPAGGIDTCYGDSGGPMQAAIGGGAYRLVGITSWGSGCAEPDAPGVYTRVAGASLRPTVASTVFDLETTFGLPHEDVVGGTDLDPPTITATSPASPANDNTPEVIGTVGAGSPTEVKIYKNESCSGAPDATGTVAQFTGAGITVNVTGDATTPLSASATDASSNDSGCSNTIDYVEDSTAPAAPTVTDTDPDSPANDNNPEVRGSAEAGSTVRLHESPSCGGPVEAQGTAATFNVPGLTAAVASDQATQFTATATDAAGNVSGCSADFDYTEDSTPPTNPTVSSPSHITGVASSDPTVEVTFSSATDGLSGVDGFSYLWDTSATTTPDMTKDAEESATGTTSPTLPDGSHYFHLRTMDVAGNWTSTVHLGPFVIEGSPEPPPITPPVLGGDSDGTPPAVQVSARLKRNGTVVLRLACNEECFAKAAGSLAAGRSSFKLKPAGTGIAAGSSALLRLAPKSSQARRAARRLLRGGASGIARIVVAFADRGGNSTIRTLRVRKK